MFHFIAVLRTWAAFLAGTNCMPWGSFLLFNALGELSGPQSTGWEATSLVIMCIGLTGPIGPITFALGLLITIASLIFVRRNERRLEEEAERALPGPLDASSPVNKGVQDQRQETYLRRDTWFD